MTTLLAELYDALIAAGAPEDKARRAAEAAAGYEAQRDLLEVRLDRVESRLDRVEAKLDDMQRDITDLKREVYLGRWMLGFVLALQIAMFVKLFLH